MEDRNLVMRGMPTRVRVHAPSVHHNPTERERNNLHGFQDFGLENGSSQGQNLALTVLLVPGLLEAGKEGARLPGRLSVSRAERQYRFVFMLLALSPKQLATP